jgi:phospholipase/carboxylesterase
MSNPAILTEKKSNLEYLKKDNGAKKVIFMLHGYGASMNDLFGLCDVIPTDQKYDWIFPNAPISVPLGGFIEGRAWFPINMQDLEKAMMSGSHRSFEDKCPDEFKSAVEIAKIFIDSIAQDYDEVIIGGFSQGAMVSSHLSSLGIEKQTGLMLLSATLIAKDMLMDNLEGKTPVPFFQSHGKQDPVLNFAESMKLFELLKLNRFQGEFIPFDGAHEIPQVVITKASEYINRLSK